MKNLIFPIVFATAIAAASGEAANVIASKDVHNGFYINKPTFTRLEADQFPIIPWGWTVGDPKALAEIKECGFNLAGFVFPEHVPLVEQAGLKCIVNDLRIASGVMKADISDEEIAQQVTDAVTPFIGNKTVYGYYLRDEPVASLFPSLAKWSAAIKKVDPTVKSYINLFPVGPPSHLNNIGGFKNYEDYVETYINTVKPEFISYDNYSLMDDGSLLPRYFENLEVIRKISMKSGLPFWNIILGNSHFHYANPSLSSFSFQVYTTLAYGGKGISYFTYFAPLGGNYRNAAIDQFLNKTPTWDLIRNINNQIHQLGPTYLQLKNVNVFHHPDVPEGCMGMDTSRYLASLEGGQFVVGEFEGPNGSQYVMIVNKDLHKSTTFNVKFKDSGVTYLTSQYTGKTLPWSGGSNWLAPGQGALISVLEPQK